MAIYRVKQDLTIDHGKNFFSKHRDGDVIASDEYFGELLDIKQLLKDKVIEKIGDGDDKLSAKAKKENIPVVDETPVEPGAAPEVAVETETHGDLPVEPEVTTEEPSL